MRKAIAVSLAVVIGLGGISSATAATNIQGGPLTGLNPAGADIHFALSNFPESAGIYLYQAVKGLEGSRPTIINSESQVWVGTANGATNPAGDVKVHVTGTFEGADCSVDICGIAARFDHTLPGDLTEDQFIPITFAAGGSTLSLPADSIVATIEGDALSTTSPGTLAYRTPMTVSVTTGSGAPATIVSSTPTCTVEGNSIIALKGSGQCDFAITSPGDSASSKKTTHFPFNLTTGEQSISKSTKSLKVGRHTLLAKRSNFGEKISYTLKKSNICSLSGKTVTGIKKGKCMLTATAPGNENYTEVNKAVKIKVRN